jgi:signal transduction histidine kinase
VRLRRAKARASARPRAERNRRLRRHASAAWRSAAATLARPGALRLLLYAGAAFGALLSALSAVLAGSIWAAWIVVILPLTLITAVLAPQRRADILAVGAAAVGALNTSDAVYLGFAVCALVFVSLAEDESERPVAGWAGGLIGGIISLFLFPGPNLAPFLATAVGVALASLLRARTQGAELSREARELRGQAAWLEQRTSLARELHDVVGHHVTAMVVQAEAGQVSDPQSALRAIAESGRTALGELDALVVHLRDPDAAVSVTAPPRLSDIDELLAQPLRHQGVRVEVSVEAEHGLDEIGVLTAYRIVQEALTNIARHAQASAAWVEVSRLGDRIRVRVSDDGVGPPGAIDRGSGLLGIQERVVARGGTWELGRRPGGGTMLDAVLPVDAP